MYDRDVTRAHERSIPYVIFDETECLELAAERFRTLPGVSEAPHEWEMVGTVEPDYDTVMEFVEDEEETFGFGLLPDGTLGVFQRAEVEAHAHVRPSLL